MPQIISQAEWPSQYNQIKPIWLAGLYANDPTIILMKQPPDCKTAIHKSVLTMNSSMCPEFICIMDGRPHKAQLQTTTSKAPMCNSNPKPGLQHICSESNTIHPLLPFMGVHLGRPHCPPTLGWPPLPPSTPMPQMLSPQPKRTMRETMNPNLIRYSNSSSPCLRSPSHQKRNN